MLTAARILVVDDELPVCKSVASVLDNGTYNVDTALSGEEALKKDKENPYDVIITDLMMPRITGMDLLITLMESRPEVMVIMITAYPSIKIAVQALKMGAFDYLPKPFTPEELRAVVSRALSRKMFLEAELVGMEHGWPKVSIPDGTCFIPNNSWIRGNEDGTVHIGVHHVVIRTINKIESLEFPNQSEKISQGDSFLWVVEDQGIIHRVWSPVTGRIIETNSGIADDIGRLMRDPYRSGWIMQISPTNLEKDLENLAQWDSS